METEEKIYHRVVSENDTWVYGKTFHNETYFGDWCKYKGTGVVPTFTSEYIPFVKPDNWAEIIRVGRREWMERTMNEEQKKAFVQKLVAEKYDLYGDLNEYV